MALTVDQEHFLRAMQNTANLTGRCWNEMRDQLKVWMERVYNAGGVFDAAELAPYGIASEADLSNWMGCAQQLLRLVDPTFETGQSVARADHLKNLARVRSDL